MRVPTLIITFLLYTTALGLMVTESVKSISIICFLFDAYTYNTKVGNWKQQAYVCHQQSLECTYTSSLAYTMYHRYTQYQFCVSTADHNSNTYSPQCYWSSYKLRSISISIFLPPIRLPPFLSCTEFSLPITTKVSISSSTVSQNRVLLDKTSTKHTNAPKQKGQIQMQVQMQRDEGKEKTWWRLGHSQQYSFPKWNHRAQNKTENKLKLSSKNKKTKIKPLKRCKRKCLKRGLN